MRILFPSHPIESKSVDDAFALEWEAARAAGLETVLLDAEALDEGAFDRATRRCTAGTEECLVLYRGWMMRVEAYQGLYNALAKRRHFLINRPEQYEHTHHFPNAYASIRAHTPHSVWTTHGAPFDLAEMMTLLTPFGNVPLIVKDYVKSQKHYWREACFIPSASDADAVQRVTKRFVELQGASLVGGLVFREFADLEPLTTHSKSGMPLTKEFRIFFLDGKPLHIVEYWEEGEYLHTVPPEALFLDIAAHIDSRFFTMDVAKRTDGSWIIMELGDAQVSGIPDRLSPQEFYRVLALHLRRGEALS